jgi:hypothetical protein
MNAHNRPDDKALTHSSDFNYERQLSDNTCLKIAGLADRPADAVCKEDASVIEYYDVSGYRKIPLSTCQGGRELQYVGESHPCPGHEEQYTRKHRLSGAGLFFAIAMPIAAACGIGWYAYARWDGKFGRIRLGEAGMVGGDLFSADQPWVAWPVAAVAAMVAVLASLPLVLGSVGRWVGGLFGRGGGGGYGGPTYTSRSSFARGRGDYVSVENDEGELLGEESDEEV